MKLFMADGSCVQPTGIIEDVPIQVDKFFLSNDFVVMDIDADVHAPIILGMPFLATAKARIYVREGLLNLTIGDAKVEFQFNKTMKGPSMDEMVETVLKVDDVAELKERNDVKQEMRDELRVVHELSNVQKKPGLRPAEEEPMETKLKVERKEEEFPPGFLPRPKEHTVYAIGEDNYAF